jgi:hypothetical protein
MTNLTLQYNDIASYAEQLQQYGTEEAFSRYTITALFDRHEAVSAMLTSREETLQVPQACHCHSLASLPPRTAPCLFSRSCLRVTLLRLVDTRVNTHLLAPFGWLTLVSG